MKSMKVRRGRGRPPKSSYIKNNNVVELQRLISFNCPKRRRTFAIDRPTPNPTTATIHDLENLPQQPPAPQQLVGVLEKSPSSTPSPPSNCSSDSYTTQFFIPGPIPDLDALFKDSSLLVNFFTNIPEEFDY